MDFVQRDGYASILVDATKDRRGVWWALIKRKVSDKMDLALLKKPGYALRIEARIRVSHAPRRDRSPARPGWPPTRPSTSTIRTSS